MVICDHPTCSLAINGHCSLPDDLALDRQGRCLRALEISGRTLDSILSFLPRFSPYPFDLEKDREFFSELLEDFPDADVLAQIKAFQAWILDLPEPPDKGYRAMFRKWVQRTREKNSPRALESSKRETSRRLF
jgi:hypothetical protein